MPRKKQVCPQKRDGSEGEELAISQGPPPSGTPSTYSKSDDGSESQVEPIERKSSEEDPGEAALSPKSEEREMAEGKVEENEIVMKSAFSIPVKESSAPNPEELEALDLRVRKRPLATESDNLIKRNSTKQVIAENPGLIEKDERKPKHEKDGSHEKDDPTPTRSAKVSRLDDAETKEQKSTMKTSASSDLFRQLYENAKNSAKIPPISSSGQLPTGPITAGLTASQPITSGFNFHSELLKLSAARLQQSPASAASSINLNAVHSSNLISSYPAPGITYPLLIHPELMNLCQMPLYNNLLPQLKLSTTSPQQPSGAKSVKTEMPLSPSMTPPTKPRAKHASHRPQESSKHTPSPSENKAKDKSSPSSSLDQLSSLVGKVGKGHGSKGVVGKESSERTSVGSKGEGEGGTRTGLTMQDLWWKYIKKEESVELKRMNEAKQIFTCLQCQASFQSMDQLVTHMKVTQHFDNVPRSYSQALQFTRQKMRQMRLKLKYSDKMMYLCTLCGLNFSGPVHLHFAEFHDMHNPVDNMQFVQIIHMPNEGGGELPLPKSEGRGSTRDTASESPTESSNGDREASLDSMNLRLMEQRTAENLVASFLASQGLGITPTQQQLSMSLQKKPSTVSSQSATKHSNKNHKRENHSRESTVIFSGTSGRSSSNSEGSIHRASLSPLGGGLQLPTVAAELLPNSR